MSSKWVYLFGVIALVVLLCRYQEQFRFGTKKDCICFALTGTVVGFVGAKTLYILENLGSSESVFSLGGISTFGAIWLVPLLMPLFGKRFGFKPSQTLDVCAPCVSLMLAFMRTGCFFHGCCGGYSISIGERVITPPVQLMEVAWNIGLTAWFICNINGKEKKGMKYPLFMTGYSFFRFFHEFLRDTDKGGMFSMGQWWAIVTMFFGISILLTQISVRDRANNKHTQRNK